MEQREKSVLKTQYQVQVSTRGCRAGADSVSPAVLHPFLLKSSGTAGQTSARQWMFLKSSRT